MKELVERFLFEEFPVSNGYPGYPRTRSNQISVPVKPVYIRPAGVDCTAHTAMDRLWVEVEVAVAVVEWLR